MLDPDKALNLIERGTIEVAPLAFMRGRTLNDSFIILDEAQNTSPEQMQMFLTRLGFGSKVVVTGDVTQIDLPREQRSGLVHVRDVLAGSRASVTSSSDTAMSCATSSCSESSRRTRSTPKSAIDDLGRGGQPKRGRGRRARRRRAGRAGAAARRESTTASSGSRSSGEDEMRALKREHLALDEVTDVLSFPIDGRDDVPDGVPRALGDVVLCPQVVRRATGVGR